jgi:hypothetical protein
MPITILHFLSIFILTNIHSSVLDYLLLLQTIKYPRLIIRVHISEQSPMICIWQWLSCYGV